MLTSTDAASQEGDLLRVAAKAANVLLDPAKSELLIMQAIVR